MKTAPSTTRQDDKKRLHGIGLKTLVLKAFVIVIFSGSLQQNATKEKSLTPAYKTQFNGEMNLAFTSRYLRINEYLFHGKELAKALV